MKAKELKIGDWVYAKVPITCEIMPCKIEKFNNDKVLAGLIWSHFDELSPIPITEEILEKNGWRENDEIWDIDYTYGKLNAEVWQWGKEMVTTISASVGNDVCTLAQIKYVHELQHILWALGMDDDLKI